MTYTCRFCGATLPVSGPKFHIAGCMLAESLFYYQIDLRPESDDPLAGKWRCCSKAGGKKHEAFYLPYFSKVDSRWPHRGEPEEGRFAVVVVKGSRGNVAGRDGCPIRPEDVIRSFNLTEEAWFIMQG